MSKIFTVFGATGNQGGSVVRAVLADPQLSKEFKVRAITRDTTKPAAKELADLGAEVVSADVNKPETLAAALEGSHTVFAVTNFWEHFSSATEIAQGKAMADAAKSASVSHLIWSSLPNITKVSGGRINGMTHFDGKAEIEEHIRSIGVPATFVLAGFYMNGFFNLIRKGEDGSYTWAMPFARGAGKMPLFDAAADTGKYVKAAVKKYGDKPEGARIYESPKYLTVDEIVSAWEEAKGEKLNFVEVTAEQYASFLPQAVAKELTDNMLLLADVGYYGGAELESSNALVEDKLTTWKEFVEANKDKW